MHDLVKLQLQKDIRDVRMIADCVESDARIETASRSASKLATKASEDELLFQHIASAYGFDVSMFDYDDEHSASKLVNEQIDAAYKNGAMNELERIEDELDELDDQDEGLVDDEDLEGITKAEAEQKLRELESQEAELEQRRQELKSRRRQLKQARSEAKTGQAEEDLEDDVLEEQREQASKDDERAQRLSSRRKELPESSDATFGETMAAKSKARESQKQARDAKLSTRADKIRTLKKERKIAKKERKKLKKKVKKARRKALRASLSGDVKEAKRQRKKLKKASLGSEQKKKELSDLKQRRRAKKAKQLSEINSVEGVRAYIEGALGIESIYHAYTMARLSVDAEIAAAVDKLYEKAFWANGYERMLVESPNIEIPLALQIDAEESGRSLDDVIQLGRTSAQAEIAKLEKKKADKEAEKTRKRVEKQERRISKREQSAQRKQMKRDVDLKSVKAFEELKGVRRLNRTEQKQLQKLRKSVDKREKEIAKKGSKVESGRTKQIARKEKLTMRQKKAEEKRAQRKMAKQAKMAQKQRVFGSRQSQMVNNDADLESFFVRPERVERLQTKLDNVENRLAIERSKVEFKMNKFQRRSQQAQQPMTTRNQAARIR